MKKASEPNFFSYFFTFFFYVSLVRKLSVNLFPRVCVLPTGASPKPWIICFTQLTSLRLARDELPIPSQGTFILFSLFIPKIFRNDFESSGPINVVLTDLYIYETKVAPGGWLGGEMRNFKHLFFSCLIFAWNVFWQLIVIRSLLTLCQ
jgi:hypothetical protein